MGREKWALPVGGRAQLLRSVELLAPLVTEVRVSCRPEQRAELGALGVALVEDAPGAEGPLAGIEAAFAAAPRAAWLVLACDLLLMDAGTLRRLVAARDPGRPATACTATGGAPEPLCAIYEPAFAPALAAARRAGELRARRVLESVSPALVPPTAPEALTNVNDPEEYRRALRRLAERGELPG